MAVITAVRPAVNPTFADSRQVPYAGHKVTGRELSRIMSARRGAYLARTGSNPYSDVLDAAMDAAGRAELDRIVLEHDRAFDRQADEAEMCDRYERGFIAL
jgi:hypothetical protein